MDFVYEVEMEHSKPDKLDGKRCMSCGKFVRKRFWHLPEDDVPGKAKVRPLCYDCSED